MAAVGINLLPKRIHIRDSTTPTREQYQQWLVEIWQLIMYIGLAKDNKDAKNEEKQAYIQTRIYNMDECGINRPDASNIRVLAPPRSDAALAVDKDKSFDHVTLCGTVNAAGQRLSPFVILRGDADKVTPSLQDRISQTPDISGYALTVKGYQTGVSFLTYLQWFHDQVKPPPSQEHPIILIIDGAPSHKDVDAIDWGTTHHIHIYMMLPNATAVCQPLDVALFGPFKRALEQYQNNCIGQGGTVSRRSVMQMIADAYNDATTKRNIKSGWRASGMAVFGPIANTSMMASDKFAPPWKPRVPQVFPIFDEAAALASLSSSSSSSTLSKESKLPSSVDAILAPRQMHGITSHHIMCST
jgi:hypothetical protein